MTQEKEMLESRCKYLETNLKETSILKYRWVESRCKYLENNLKETSSLKYRWEERKRRTSYTLKYLFNIFGRTFFQSWEISKVCNIRLKILTYLIILSMDLFICRFIYLYIDLFTYLSIYLPIYLSIYLFIHLFLIFFKPV